VEVNPGLPESPGNPETGLPGFPVQTTNYMSTQTRIKRPTEGEIQSQFRKCNFRFHSTGTLSTNRNGSKVHLYDYYEGDVLTADQRSRFKAQWGDAVKFLTLQSQYAPETGFRPIVCIAKSARLKELNA